MRDDDERQAEVFDYEIPVSGPAPEGWDGSPWALIGEITVDDSGGEQLRRELDVMTRAALQSDQEAANAATPHAEPHAEDMDRESFERYIEAVGDLDDDDDDDDEEDYDPEGVYDDYMDQPD